MSLIKNNRQGMPSLPALFNDFFSRDLFNWDTFNNSTSNTTIPAVNLRETNDEYLVELAAPGLKKEDFKVNLEANRLSISSEFRSESEDQQGGKYTSREFSYQSFKRTLILPDGLVDEDGIKARYDSGLLHITIPKREEAKKKAPRQIAIS
ncbi:Hsp20/alpha crystallin family protein [Olivibacter domesticus]|uniref:HSP20 family protein n=1 Tax=Olivibacter domesticus TaxID=407022 RepID=A0A1H7L0T7_OLID1|nr:Hsp20/alpha crystallin family protein [Olivibacter domesticus]SEK92659.1 HSP20 family protein [Olivibacter domesticus]